MVEAENTFRQLAQKISKVVNPSMIITQLPNISGKLFCGIPVVSLCLYEILAKARGTLSMRPLPGRPISAWHPCFRSFQSQVLTS